MKDKMCSDRWRYYSPGSQETTFWPGVARRGFIDIRDGVQAFTEGRKLKSAGQGVAGFFVLGTMGRFPGIIYLIVVGLAITSFAVRILGQFRGLIFPLFRNKSGGKLRQLLRVHSYLPRWVSASVLLGEWLLGIIAVWLMLLFLLKVGHQFSKGWLAALFGVFAVFVASAYAAVAWFRYRAVCTAEQKRIQRKRDRRARGVLAQLRSIEQAPFAYSVWLRPFSSTGRIWVIERSKYVKLKSEDFSKQGYHVEWGDFETFLAIVLEPFAPLIALGASGEQIGAGRIGASEDWQDTFKLLAGSAHSVFLLPSHRSGTQWEFRWLLETPRILRRCIFVVPPLPDLKLRIRASFAAPGVKDLPSTKLSERGYFTLGQQALWDVRREVMKTLAQILLPEEYAKLERARHGALFQLSGESGLHIVRYSELAVSEPWWTYWSGPRFSQSRLRSAVLDLIKFINNLTKARLNPPRQALTQVAVRDRECPCLAPPSGNTGPRN